MNMVQRMEQELKDALSEEASKVKTAEDTLNKVFDELSEYLEQNGNSEPVSSQISEILEEVRSAISFYFGERY